MSGSVGSRENRYSGLPWVAGGVLVFLVFQYGVALWRLTQRSGGMMNKFSALARERYLDFLVWENVSLVPAYGVLLVVFVLVIFPLVVGFRKRLRLERRGWALAVGFCAAGLVHGYCTLRLLDTRPYFLNDAQFGYWYYEVLRVIPEVARPAVFLVLFKVLPVLVFLYAGWWWCWCGGKVVRGAAVGLVAVVTMWGGWVWFGGRSVEVAGGGERRMNVLIIGSDSLRGDKLGYAGYRPRRTDGAAVAGVSPHIDRLAGDSARMMRCYVPIASTLESGTSLIASMYPHTHGFRHMYPDREQVEETTERIESLAGVLRREGYDTAAIGDWCAGYYELMPMEFEHVSVSSFDNFKIYMSQAVIMAHFVIPLYFDHELGYAMFPQLQSFAQFVTPRVVTERVERRLAKVAEEGRPFFWHVFYSCNHLPYRSPEPYASMFTDPDYEGPNRNGVDFDIDGFIGSTDLESKWEVLPEKEIQQIRDLYDGCTRQFDDCVGRILAALERHGLADYTIVIVTSDHGDDLYEPGVTLGHGLTFNGGLQASHVPLVLKVPGMEGREFGEQVRLLDVAPTVTDLLGLEAPGSWEGRSFAPWLRGEAEAKSRAFYGETGFPFIQFRVDGVERPVLPAMDEMTFIDEGFNYQFVLKEEYRKRLVEAKQRCLKTDRWKLVCTPTAAGGRHFQLYDMWDDPHGEVDVAGDFPEVLGVTRVALERWMDEGVETSIGEMFPGRE